MLRNLLLLLTLIVVSAAPAFAQDATSWRAYLYNSSTRQLVAIALDGAQATYDLGLAADAYPMQSDFPISPDGNLTAYCVATVAPGGTAQTLTLVIRNLPTATDVARYDLSAGLACYVGGFSADGTQIALGVVRGFPGDPAIDPAAPLWQVLTIDAATGSTTNSVDNTSIGIDPADDSARFANLPLIRSYSPDALIFSLQPYATEGNPDAPAYRWEMATGSLAPVSGWSGFALDTLASTGEKVWLDYDPARPSGTPLGPISIFNVVKVTDASGMDSIIYESGASWLPYDVAFINNGQQVLVTLTESGDPNNPMVMPGSKLVVIDRDGAITELGIYGSFVQAAAAPDGFVLLWAEATDGTTPPTLHLDYISTQENRELWRIVSDNPGISWNISSTTPVAVATGELAAFMALQ
jgi:hypothetical protein